MLSWWDILLRLGSAALVGALIGLNRDLKGKPIGLRTLALVGLGAALLVALAEQSVARDAISSEAARIIQGILTGIGFLGAGVIVHTGSRYQVHGLTTAACVWLAAAIGIACGAGQWLIVVVAVVISFVVLLGGHAVERFAARRLGATSSDNDPPED